MLIKESLDKIRKAIFACGPPALLPILRSPHSLPALWETSKKCSSQIQRGGAVETELLNPSRLPWQAESHKGTHGVRHRCPKPEGKLAVKP